MANASISSKIESQLDEAERAKRCLFVVGQSTRRAFDRRSSAVCSLAPGIYARRVYWESLNPLDKSLHLMRALSAQYPEWQFTGVSAAAAHGLYVSYQDLMRNGVPVLHVRGKSRTLRYDGCIIEFSELFAREPISSLFKEGVRVVPSGLAALDCACRLPFERALGIADSLLSLEDFTRESLVAFARFWGKGRRGLHSALRTFSYADARSENGGESFARAVMIEEGFAVPELQVPVEDPMGDGEYRVDYQWVLPDGTHIYGELDGLVKTTDEEMMNGRTPAEVERDERLRESRITVDGARVVRFTIDLVKNRPSFRWLLDCYGVPREADVSR